MSPGNSGYSCGSSSAQPNPQPSSSIACFLTCRLTLLQHVLKRARISRDTKSHKMSYSTTTSAYVLFPTSSPSNGSSIIASTHTPRNTHTTYEEFGRILRSSNGQQSERKNSITSSLKKLFGGI
ncbi:hypothetical protein BC835DRAFT_1394704 [Cytidiella melzeri]|nr:hypothetical protein BC835DRAFT_1394704 [Cytidiella melzeri]